MYKKPKSEVYKNKKVSTKLQSSKNQRLYYSK
jgi:hypothetical protein